MTSGYGNWSGSNRKGNGNGNVKGIDFVFPISQELKDQGIEGFRIKDENAILTLQNNMILFPFCQKNYSKSIDKLRNGLESRRVDDRLIAFYCLKITELLLEYVLDNKTGKVVKRPKEEQEAWKEMQVIIDEIRRLRKQYSDIPFSVWEEERKKRFDNLYNIVKEKIPQAWESIEIVLTVKGIRHIRDITLPVIVITIGDPGTWKTLGIGLVRRWPDVLYKDKISAKSWVSHASKEDVKELEAIDLIRQMKDHMFAVPELAPIFMQREDILVDTLSTLVRLADGEGFLGHSGLWGDRGIDGTPPRVQGSD